VYEEVVRVYDGAGVELPPFDAIEDIASLREFIGFVSGTGLAAPVGGQGTFGGLDVSGLTGALGWMAGIAGIPTPSPAPPTGTSTPTSAAAAVPELVSIWPYLSQDQ